MENKFEKALSEITPEEIGFEIHPKCKLCNSIYKMEIDKMILEGVATKRIVDFCMIKNPVNNRQRVPGTEDTIQRNIQRHRKHIAIDDAQLEEVQQKSMVLYQKKVKENVSLGMAKKIATQRMVDELSDAQNVFSLGELAIPINLEQRERSVKVEEGALQINFAKFIKSNEDGQISGNEVESLENSIRELNERIASVGREIQNIEGPREKTVG